MTETQNLTVSPVSTPKKVIFFSFISIFGTFLYFTTLHSIRYAPAVIPATPIDNLIPFVPWFIVVYFSFFIFMPLPLVFIRTMQEFVPSAFGFFLVISISNLFFLFWPTVIPPGAPHDPLLNGLFAVDRDRNACPSLHASLALYCALVMHKHVLKYKFGPALLWTWTLLIMASPLLIKRHMSIDIAVGSILAAAVYAFARSPWWLKQSWLQPPASRHL